MLLRAAPRPKWRPWATAAKQRSWLGSNIDARLGSIDAPSSLNARRSRPSTAAERQTRESRAMAAAAPSTPPPNRSKAALRDIGPSDLAADLGHLGDAGHPEVQDAIAGACERIRAAGKPAGILTGVEADARRYLRSGFTFVAVGSDVGLLAAGSTNLAARMREATGKPERGPRPTTKKARKEKRG
jgi:hypothetical protein